MNQKRTTEGETALTIKPAAVIANNSDANEELCDEIPMTFPQKVRTKS